MQTPADNEDTTSSSLIEWDENGLPVSKQFNDIYFSKLSGIEETRYVFIEGNQLPQRWQQLDNTDMFTIGETGFGTGLNFLTTWQYWQQCANNSRTRLHFISVEKYPLTRSDLEKSLALWPELTSLSRQLVDAYPPQAFKGLTRLQFDQGNVQLSLFFGEAHECFEELAPIAWWRAGEKTKSTSCALGSKPTKVDAWFLDGFSPAKNPDMWSEILFQAIKNISAAETTFATFTAAALVKHQLHALGFEYSKRKGFGEKRDMLWGRIPKQAFSTTLLPDESHTKSERDRNIPKHKSRNNSREPSWHLIETQNRLQAANQKIQHCAVIGGGLAGCHTAFALAQKNIRVTVIEKTSALATATSGNMQGVVYAKLSPHREPISDFNLAALIFANHFYASKGFYASCGQQCGVAHLAVDQREQQLYQEFCALFPNEQQFARWINTDKIKTISGLNGRYPALYLPQAGWLSPKKLCRELTAAPGKISCLFSTHVHKLDYSAAEGWQLFDQHGARLIHADAVVIANAHDAKQLSHCHYLPLKTIRGQISHLPATETTSQLKTVLCGEGYVAPAVDRQHAFGATFTLKNSDPAVTVEDHQENLAMLEKLSPDFAPYCGQLTGLDLAGRVGFRCTTPDYLPAVGPVPIYSDMIQRFQFLNKKANAVIDESGIAYPNLYCNLAHGSRGLCYTPLCAEIIASLISGDFLPIPRSLYTFLAPARFIIRDLMRNKI